MAEQLPTTAQPRHVQLKHQAGQVTVRRLRKSKLAVMMNIAGVEGEKAGPMLVLQELIFRWGVINAEGIVDGDTGQEVKFKQTNDSRLGRLCQVGLYDAIEHPKDLKEIMSEISPDIDIDEDAAGN